MGKRSRIARLRTLYATFIGIIAVCIVLFFLNVISSTDPLELHKPLDERHDYGFIITDLNSSTPLRHEGHTIEHMPDGIKATAHISRFDLNVAADDAELLHSSSASWCWWLQVFSVVAGLAMIVFVLMALISFYVNVRRGKVFPKRHIKWLVWAGVLMIAMSLSMDASTWIEQAIAFDLLKGSEWTTAANFSINLTRIFFGLTIIFMAEIFYIGREMQEEQELTI